MKIYFIFSLRNLPSFWNDVSLFKSNSLWILEQNFSERIQQHLRTLRRRISIRSELLQLLQEAGNSGKHFFVRSVHNCGFANRQSTKKCSNQQLHKFLIWKDFLLNLCSFNSNNNNNNNLFIVKLNMVFLIWSHTNRPKTLQIK